MRDEEGLHDDQRLMEELVSLHGRILANDESHENLPAEFAEELGSAAQLFQLIERVSRDEDDDTATRNASTLVNPQSQPADANIVYDESDADGLQSLRRIGRFEIEDELGRGGYGIVFLARDTDLNRNVALKVPRPEAIFTDEMRERFLREGKAAALLSHPQIVPVFETGRIGHVCYTVSRYVPGITLAEWLARHGQCHPHPAARLVATLADAVQHAHSKGVVHRDLKPSNVLLEGAPEDAGLAETELHSAARIADFGLAKNSIDDEGLTASNAIVGTPAYMSPEQSQGGNQIGPATDVYALGAMLYELVTGRTPFRGNSVVQTLRQVQEVEPASPRRLNPSIDRDLEAICLKCLEKEPRRRFHTAADLQRDLQNYLAGEPVRARPVTPMEKSWRWCGRNRMLAATLAALCVSVVLGAALFGHQFRKTLAVNEQLQLNNESLRLANQQLTEARDDAQTNAKFLAESFSRADPAQDGREVTMASMLDRQLRLVRSDDKLPKRTQASLAFSLGRAYQGLGLLDEAISAYEFSDAQLVGAENADAFRVEVNGQRGFAYVEAGRHDEATELLEQWVEVSRKSFGKNDTKTRSATNHLALAYQGAGQQNHSVQTMEQLFQSIESLEDISEEDRHQTTSNLGYVLAAAGRFDEAIPYQEQALRLARELFGDENPKTLTVASNLATSYLGVGRHQDAAPLLEETLHVRRTVLGDVHPKTLQAENNLAGAFMTSGNVGQSVELLERLVPRLQRLMGDEHPMTLGTKLNLGGGYLWSNRPVEAAEAFGAVWRQMKASHGDDHPLTVKSYELLGRALADSGENAEAQRVFGELLASERRRDPQRQGRIAKLLWLLSGALVGEGKDGEAEHLLRESVRLYEEHRPDHWQFADAESLLGYVLVRLGKPNEGKEFLETGYRRLADAAADIPGPRRETVLSTASRRREVMP